MIFLPLIFASIVPVVAPQDLPTPYPFVAECHYINDYNGGAFYDTTINEWVYSGYHLDLKTYLTYDSNGNYSFSTCIFDFTIEVYDFSGGSYSTYYYQYGDSDYSGNAFDYRLSFTGYDDGFQAEIYRNNTLLDNHYIDIGDGTDYIGYDYGFNTTYFQSQLSDFLYKRTSESNYGSGYADGYQDGYDVGLSDGNAQGYQIGYDDGFTEAYNQDTTAATIFSGILEVGLLPINVFLLIFNYEVFGINISGLVSGLLTIAVVLIIIRVILNKSGGNGGGNKS